MVSQAFQLHFAIYIHVASLSVLLWDLLNNLKDMYSMVSRHRLRFPIVVYFLSRISVLGFAIISTIFLTTQSVACAAFEDIFLTFFIVGMVSTLYLSYLRVCAVWHWNRFVVGLFGISWLSVIGSCFALIKSIKGVEEGGYCVQIILEERVLAPQITAFVNHTLVFLAITLGVCKNTLGKDLSVRDYILGRNLPTFSKALLHDSQLCYLITMTVTAISTTWYAVWLHIDRKSSFRLVMTGPYVVLVNIMICRVFRNTKLGLYSKVPVQSNANDIRLQTHAASNGTISWSSHGTNDSDGPSIPAMPIQIAVNQVVEYKSDYPKSNRNPAFLDFGMV